MKRPSNLSDSLHQRLNSYALAASAAGVGILALAQPVEGRIVYTHTHHVIGKKSYFAIDMNQDGIWDFSIINSAFRSNRTSVNFIGAKGNDVVYGGVAGSFRSPDTFLALALKRGERISAAQRFYSRGDMAGQCVGTGNLSSFPCRNRSENTSGNWVNVTNGYLGLSFMIHGKIHYGWARLSVQVKKHTVTGTLTGYAYETIPNKPIIAGKTHGKDVIAVQPASLGHLARGASAIPAWRGAD
jgi:hypothetical protein